MGIRVVRGERADLLAAALAQELAAAARDPFHAELIVVPTRGIERFLTQYIADHIGIAANLDFLLPGDFLGGLAARDDPWAPQRLVWPLLRVIDANRSQPWCRPLEAHLQPTPDWDRNDRRFAVAMRLAGLFANYAMERPGLVAGWEHGHAGDVPDDLLWQYELWRELRRVVGPVPAPSVPDNGSLPRRVSVFGPTRLPEQLLSALEALAAHRAIDLYLPIPSAALWNAEGWGRSALRRSDGSHSLAVHPLLRSLGRDTRELRQRLGAGGSDLRADSRGSSVLAQLQGQLRRNEASALAELEPDDSLQIHACHGPQRQVEVVREVILRLLQEHPDLQPRDIIIMTPDLETYAPLIAAAFSGPDDRIRDLRLSIADRTKEQGNEVLAALDALLHLLPSRIKRSDLLDLLGRAAVRDRLGLSADDVARIDELSASAGVRWGLDAQHRAEYGLDGIDLGTWAWGMRRMALGAAMSDRDLAAFGGVLPLPDVTSGDARLLGVLATVLRDLAALRVQARQQHTMRAWNALLQQAVADFTDARYAKSWQTANALGAVEAFVRAAGDHADTVPLSLADIRHMLASVLAGRPTRSGFRQGGMTACRLEPMRSVPYGVVVLVGMDDGAFPRRGSGDGDDLLLREPRIGERDVRSEDRQLFLDAVMAATRHLVVAYTGRDERSNARRQPAVPLAELIDLLPKRPGTVREHPLQPFDPANFDPADPFSHDVDALAGALVARQPRLAAGPLFGPLPAGAAAAPDADDGAPALEELVRFLADPLSSFLDRSPGLRPRRTSSQPSERLPISLTGLDAWQVGNGLVTLQRQQEETGPFEAAKRLDGTMPPDALGSACLDAIRTTAADIGERISAETGGVPAAQREVPLPWAPDRTALIDSLHGDVLLRWTYSRDKPSHLLMLWPPLLCLKAAHPDVAWRAVFVAKERNRYLDPPDDPAECVRLLADLVQLFRWGGRSPLPIPPGTSSAYAADRRTGDRSKALLKAQDTWEGERFPEHASEAAALTYGYRAPFAALLSEAAGPDEGWGPDAGITRFEALSCRIWDPLLPLSNSGKGGAGKASAAKRSPKREGSSG